MGLLDNPRMTLIAIVAATGLEVESFTTPSDVWAQWRKLPMGTFVIGRDRTPAVLKRSGRGLQFLLRRQAWLGLQPLNPSSTKWPRSSWCSGCGPLATKPGSSSPELRHQASNGRQTFWYRRHADLLLSRCNWPNSMGTSTGAGQRATGPVAFQSRGWCAVLTLWR